MPEWCLFKTSPKYSDIKLMPRTINGGLSSQDQDQVVEAKQ